MLAAASHLATVHAWVAFGIWPLAVGTRSPNSCRAGDWRCHKQHAANSLGNWTTFRKLPRLITCTVCTCMSLCTVFKNREIVVYIDLIWLNRTHYDSIWFKNYHSIRFNTIRYDSILSRFWSWFDSICLETSQALMPRQTLPRLSVRLPRPQHDILGVTERPCPWMRCCQCCTRKSVQILCTLDIWHCKMLRSCALALWNSVKIRTIKGI